MLDTFLQNASRDCSVLPFWFWNDRLTRDGLIEQIESFERNGVYGFVIHPRVGLPRDLGWMSEGLLGFYRLAIVEAERRDMKVLLYDEGMYPSGSSCGQVVERWPELACRCLALLAPDAALPATAEVVADIELDDGRSMRVIHRPVDAYIRGLHYHGEDPDEDEPPASDLLNPRTASAVIELVYDRFRREFGKHFGKTILGIFTDEPNPLGKCREKDVWPGTTGILDDVSRLLGYDFTPHLASLWSEKPEAQRYRDDYRRAIRMRMEETWYAPLSQWCEQHNVALCGHPDAGDEIGAQQYFQIPGQDLVWRWVAPDTKTALEGPEATQAKCSSSAMIHAGRRRNSNEFAGAYGAETTFEEIQWLANWCLVRGVNLLIPHAFYYTVRGPRRDERPPQIGPHTPQWDRDFKSFADHCRQMCWLNTDSRHVCHVAVLTNEDRCPWPAAAAIVTGQRDFNYLDPHTLLHRAEVSGDGISIGEMRYELLVIDAYTPLDETVLKALKPMIDGGRVVRFGTSADDSLPSVAQRDELIERIDQARPPEISIDCDSDALRVRVIEKQNRRVVMLFNESLKQSFSLSIAPSDAGGLAKQEIDLPPGQLKVVEIEHEWMKLAAATARSA